MAKEPKSKKEIPKKLTKAKPDIFDQNEEEDDGENDEAQVEVSEENDEDEIPKAKTKKQKKQELLKKLKSKRNTKQEIDFEEKSMASLDEVSILKESIPSIPKNMAAV